VKHVMDILTVGQRPDKDTLRKGLLNLVNLQGWDELAAMDFSAMFLAAVAELGEAGRFSLPEGDYALNGDLTIPAASAVLTTPGASLFIGPGAHLHVSGQFGAWTESRVFSGSGTVQAAGGVWLPGWFVDAGASFEDIAAGAITVTSGQGYLLPESSESRTTDALTDIAAAPTDDRRVLLSPIRDGDAITVRHAAGNISLRDAADLVLQGPGDKLVLRWDESAGVWREFARLLGTVLSPAEQSVQIAHSLAEAGAGLQIMDVQGLQSALDARARMASPNLWTAPQEYEQTALVIDAGTVTWDMAAAPRALLTLTEDVTAMTITNPGPGELTLVQDATGWRSVAWPASIRWPGGRAPEVTPEPGAEDVVTFVERDGVLRGTALQDFRVVE